MASNPFGTFVDTSEFSELPMANEDIRATMNATLPSQASSGTTAYSYLSEELQGLDEESRREKLKRMEKEELQRLKGVVNHWESELKKAMNIYQESLLRSLLSSTKERIRILEELELTGNDFSLIQELRSRVDELNLKADRAKLLIRKNGLGAEQAIKSGPGAVDQFRRLMMHPLDSFQEARGRAACMSERLRQTMMEYQDMIGKFLAFFMVLFFGNLGWREKGLHLWNGFLALSHWTINSWRNELKLKELMATQESAIYSLFMLPWRAFRFFWLFGWVSWSFGLMKRFTVMTYDYLSPILSEEHSLYGSFKHVSQDARHRIHERSEDLKQSVARGAHRVMSPVEDAAEKYIQNDVVKGKLRNAFQAVDPLFEKTAQAPGVTQPKQKTTDRKSVV